MKLKDILLKEEAYALPAGKDRKAVVWHEIEKFVSSKPKFFITMTAINKVGINPNFGYNNPIGIYCYQLTPTIFEQLKKNSLPFVGDQPYINVITPAGQFLHIEEYTKEDYKKDKLRLKNKFDGDDKEWNKIVDYCENSGDNRYADLAFGWLWFLTRELATRSGPNKYDLSKRSRTILWRKLLVGLGYDNIVDPGVGVIHPNEPEQSLLMNVPQIKIVKTFLNPNAFGVNDKSDESDKKILKNKYNKLDKESVSIDKSGKITERNSKGRIISVAWIEINDDGTYEHDPEKQQLAIRPEPSRIKYVAEDITKYLWKRRNGAIRRYVDSDEVIFKLELGNRTLSYRRNSSDNIASIEFSNYEKRFKFTIGCDCNDLNGPGDGIFTNLNNHGVYVIENKGDGWDYVEKEKKRAKEKNTEGELIKLPKLPNFPDASFFETQMKMPM